MVQCIRKMIRGYSEIMSEDFITMTIGKQKNIALIAHDSKKELMVQFCTAYCRILSQHKLVATGTTGKLTIDGIAIKD